MDNTAHDDLRSKQSPIAICGAGTRLPSGIGGLEECRSVQDNSSSSSSGASDLALGHDETSETTGMFQAESKYLMHSLQLNNLPLYSHQYSEND